MLKSDLVQVKILTTPDFYYVLEGGGRSLVIPQEEDDGTLLSWIQKLPGFDNAAFIQATTSTEQKEFLCWQKTG